MEIIEKIFDAKTGEETIIEREETAQEIAAREEDLAREAKFEAKLAAKAAARKPILERLGLTEEEAKLLLG